MSQGVTLQRSIHDFTPDGPSYPVPNSLYVKDTEHGWVFGGHPEFTEDQRRRLWASLLQRRNTCFAYSLNDLPGYTGIDGPLTLTLKPGCTAVFTKPRRYSPAEYEIMDDKCGELLQAGIIVKAPPDCAFASAPVLPAKKDADGNWVERRLCMDYRKLNDALEVDRYGLPLPEELFRAVGKARFFTKVDLRGAFNQIPIKAEHQKLTAFHWRHALYMYTRAPFGICTIPAKAQRIMDRELAAAGLTGFAMCFIDDILIYSDTAEEHIQHVQQVLDMLHSCNLRAHPDKSIFAANAVEYLGFLIGEGYLAPHDAKVQAIRSLRSPTCVSELRSVIGLCNYYRCFLPDFSQVANPLYALLKKGVKWQWLSEQETAFQQLKDLLCEEGRALRRFDQDAATVVYSDWSGRGIGAVLGQLDADGREYMVACCSRSLNIHEANYSSYEGEMLAAVWAIKTFRTYLHGRPFKLVTDHQPLRWITTTTDLTGKHARWALSLQEFTFEIVHRPGLDHCNADLPSRFPLPHAHDGTGACLDPAPPSVADAAALFTADIRASLHRAAAGAVLDMVPPVADFMDSYAPPSRQLAAGFDGRMHDTFFIEPAADSPAAQQETERWRRRVAKWIAQAAPSLPQAAPAAVLPLQMLGPADEHGVGFALSLDTNLVGPTLFAKAGQQGIVLVELFGGICSGLDACLTAGMRIAQYMYADVDSAARTVARQRIDAFHASHPTLFPFSASATAFTALPQDVSAIGTTDLIAAGALGGQQWLVMAGWPCQDLSPAGTGRGLSGRRSSLFFDTVRVLGALQALQPQMPPAFVLENTALQCYRQHELQDDFATICAAIGAPVLVDAAAVGSYAHRLRNFWTNLVDSSQLQLVVDTMARPAGRTVDQVLDPGRQAQLPSRTDQPPFYVCNRVGYPMEALPTLVAFPGSRSFSNGKPGMVQMVATGELVEPNPDERERILGYPTGCTAAPGVSTEDRHRLTGQAIDGRCLRALLVVCSALTDLQPHVAAAMRSVQARAGAVNLNCLTRAHPTLLLPRQQPPLLPPLPTAKLTRGPGARIMLSRGWVPGQPLPAPSATNAIPTPLHLPSNPGTAGLGYAPASRLGGCGLPDFASLSLTDRTAAQPYASQPSSLRVCCPSHQRQCMHTSSTTTPQKFPSDSDIYDDNLALATEAQQADAATLPNNKLWDIWQDQHAVKWLQTGQTDVGPGSKQRLVRRAKPYRFSGNQLLRVMADGSTRVVPPPRERVGLIKKVHESTGHFGTKRTRHHLLCSFWWWGMERDISVVLASCEVCSRVKATFNANQPELQPLPIQGLFYRWGVDMAGPLPTSSSGNRYVMIMIEYFSKTMEVVPLPEKSAKLTAAAFLSNVMSRYGACAEVVTDQGAEFQDAFHQLLKEAMVDHRTTSANHPQADGLAERAVQTIKKGLEKFVTGRQDTSEWDSYLFWIALGYRTSPQAATGLSPYQLLYGCRPVIPPAIKERVEKPLLDFGSPNKAFGYLLQRAKLLKQHCAVAMENHRIAQHRDTLRYSTVRSGFYHTPLRKFQEGDFVYLRRTKVVNSLQTEARPGIFRIKQVKPSGVLGLQGRCGRITEQHSSNCAPCHLLNINPTLDPTLATLEADFPCSICLSPDDEHLMIICDNCGGGFHTYCLQPPLSAVPEEPIWVCPACTSLGVTHQFVEEQRTLGLPAQPPEPIIFPNVHQREADAKALELDGRIVSITTKQRGTPAQVKQYKLVYVPRHRRMEHPRRPLALEAPDEETQYITRQAALRLLGNQATATLTVLETSQDTQAIAEALPDNWDWNDQAAARAAHHALLGMDPLEQDMLEFMQQIPTALNASAPALDYNRDNLAALFSAVDLRCTARLVDPWARNSTLAASLKERWGKKLIPLAKQYPTLAEPQVAHLLAPSFLRTLARKAPVDWVFLAPPAGLEDLSLALASKYAAQGVAMLVPCQYLHKQPVYRARWLGGFKTADRLAFVMSPAHDFLWVCLFAHSGRRTRQLALQGSCRQSWVLI